MAARSFTLPRPRALTPARSRAHGLKRLAVLVAAIALLVGGWSWLRDSSLVGVTQVDISGVSGEQSADIATAIRNAAHDMTTLHVDAGVIEQAVANYPIVKGVDVSADFPHTLKVTVRQHVPVAIIVVGGRKVPVAADGTLLRDTLASQLPVMPLKQPPVGDRLTDRDELASVALLAAAPPEMRAAIGKVFLGPRGLTVRLKIGTALYFGSGERLRAKWAAAVAVLADASSHGATTLDLRVPERPAAGGLEPIVQQDPQQLQNTTTTTQDAVTP